MGADLYLTDIFAEHAKRYEPKLDEWAEKRNAFRQTGDRKAQAEAQKKVDYYFGKMHERGYFRDSYNSSNLLRLFDLSWWFDVDNQLVDRQNRMSPRRAQQFLELLSQREPTFEAKLRTTEPFPGETQAETLHYFRDKYKCLRTFLRESIATKTYIVCWL